MAQLQITIDDGPKEAKDLDKILKALDREANGIVAAFFVIGNELDKGSLEQIRAAGHVLGNHSWDHFADGNYGKDAIREQFKKTHDRVKDLTGVTMKYWRAPELKNVTQIAPVLTTGEHPLYSLSHCDAHGISDDTADANPATMRAHIKTALAKYPNVQVPRLLFHVIPGTAEHLATALRDLRDKDHHTLVSFQQGS